MKCSICGADIDAGDRICQYCGNTIPVPDIKFDSPAKPDAPMPPRNFCPRCGGPLTDGRCPSCDSETASDPPRKIEAKHVPIEDETEENKYEEEYVNMPAPKKKKKKHTALIVTLSVIILIALFITSFTIFFRLLGGSFDESVSPEPAVTTAAAATIAPTATPLPVKTAEPTRGPTHANIDDNEAEDREIPDIRTQPPAPAQNAEIESIPPRGSSSYSLNRKTVGYDELSEMSRGEIRIMLNEIYARHGYTFEDDDLIEYFESQSWYIPTVSDFNEILDDLNETELENRDIIMDYQREMGWRQ